MKKLFLLFFLFLSCSVMHAESINDYAYKKFEPSIAPVLHKYLSDYVHSLYFKYNPAIYPHPGFCQTGFYFITKSGSIIYPDGKTTGFDKESTKFRQFIINNPPPPIPKEIEDKVIPARISICIAKPITTEYNSVRIKTYEHVGWGKFQALYITADKSIKYKNMTQKKCERMGCKWNSEGGYCITPYKNE